MAEEPAGSAPRAVLHDIRYSRYDGSLRPRSAAVASFAAASVRRPLGLRRSAGSKVWPFLLLAVAHLPALAVVAVPLLVPQVTLQPTELLSYSRLLSIDGVVLLAFVATAIPSMLTRDRRDRVLSLYFATAVSWLEYLIGTALAAVSLLAMIVLGPLLVLFVGSIATADDPGRWVADNAGDLPRIVVAAAVVVVFHTVLGLLVGSLTSRRVFAVGGYLAVVLVAPVVAVLLSTVLGQEWPLALDPASGPVRLASAIVDGGAAGPGGLAWVVWTAVVVGGSAVVAARYFPRGRRVSAVVELTGVSKWFGDTVALSDVSFALDAGVTGLLGHNGAGKSTVLSLLAGFARPSQGVVRVLGVDPHAESGVNRGLGVVSDGEGTWAHASARAQVEFLARQRGVRDPRSAARGALARVGLAEAADRRVGGFSKGMRQRVKLAQALVHDPQVLLLDEPLNGLDPAQRRADVDLVAALGAEGRTVLVSSHVLAEVERMAGRVLVVVNGRLVAEGEPAGIRDLLVDRPRTLRLDGTRVAELAGLLLAEGLVVAVRTDPDGRGVVVETPRAAGLADAVPALAQRVGATLRRVEPVGEDLESTFAHLVRAARGAGR